MIESHPTNQLKHNERSSTEPRSQTFSMTSSDVSKVRFSFLCRRVTSMACVARVQCTFMKRRKRIHFARKRGKTKTFWNDRDRGWCNDAPLRGQSSADGPVVSFMAGFIIAFLACIRFCGTLVLCRSKDKIMNFCIATTSIISGTYKRDTHGEKDKRITSFLLFCYFTI